MNRRWIAFAGLLTVFSAATAQACRIIIPVPPPWPPHPPWPRPEPPPPPPRIEPMQTREHRAEITVTGPAARIEVEAVFYNPNPHRIEGEYFFPIEPEAVVRDFAMTVDGREMKAELLDAEKARKIYEEIVRRQKDPALLEFAGTRMLRARIFPIEPRAEVKVRLVYTQMTRADAGVFHLRYPLRSAKPEQGKIGQLSLRATVRAEAPMRLFYSPSHALDVVRKSETEVVGGFEQKDAAADRDVDLYWTLNRADVDVSAVTWKPRDEDGFVLLALAPKLRVDPERVVPKDIVFVFDRSGSMAGDKIRQARGALSYCLERLDPRDRFAVLAFGTDVDPLTEGLRETTPEVVRAAKERVAGMEARGGTAIHDALGAALGLLQDSSRLAIVVFLTDGRPTVGPTGTDEILAAARKANTAKARLFVFGVGFDLNTDLLDRLATENGGAQQYVVEGEDLEIKVSSFYDKIAQPILSDVAIEAEGVELRDVYPRNVPDVFAGGQVVLFGRYRGDGRRRVIVRGTADGQPRRFEAEVNFDGVAGADFIPSLWAHRKVAFLMEEIRLRGKNRELEDEIVALGKRYGILTPYTSFLVAEDETPAARERVREWRRGFEGGDVSGARGVGFSRNLADAKTMSAPAAATPAAEALAVGFDRGADWTALREEMPEIARAAERVRRVADKVFIRQADGMYQDTAFEEGMRSRIVEIRRFSDEYFALLDRHPGIGRYLAAGWNMILVVDGNAYRIVE